MFAHRLPQGAGLGVLIALVGALSAREGAAQTPIPPSAPDFAMAAAQSDQYEIQAAWAAAAQTQNAPVRAFAQEMVDAHTQMGYSLRQAATASHLPPLTPAMSSDQAMMLAALQSLRGADFDTSYAKQQMLAHEQALAIGKSYASAGTDPNLRTVAQTEVAIIQHHLEMAQQLAASLGGH